MEIKILIINKSVKALIPRKVGHQGILKLYVPWRGCSIVGKKWGSKKGIFSVVEK